MEDYDEDQVKIRFYGGNTYCIHNSCIDNRVFQFFDNRKYGQDSECPSK